MFKVRETPRGELFLGEANLLMVHETARVQDRMPIQLISCVQVTVVLPAVVEHL